MIQVILDRKIIFKLDKIQIIMEINIPLTTIIRPVMKIWSKKFL